MSQRPARKISGPLKLNGGITLSSKDLKSIWRLRKSGAVNPIWTFQAAREYKIPLALARAMLEQESGGGINEFGHDRGMPFAGAGKVTKSKYLAYKAIRGNKGQGGMQGVGPLQLTYFEFQDLADSIGGCWKPLPNLLTGFRILRGNITQSGLHDGIAAYNGSGAQAQMYANSVLAYMDHFHKVYGLGVA